MSSIYLNKPPAKTLAVSCGACNTEKPAGSSFQDKKDVFLLHRSGERMPSMGRPCLTLTETTSPHAFGFSQNLTSPSLGVDINLRGSLKCCPIAQAPMVGVAIFNATGDCVYANVTFALLTGYNEQELLNMHFSNIATDNQDGLLLSKYQACVNGDLPHWYLTMRFGENAGNFFWGRVYISLLNGNTSSPPRTLWIVHPALNHCQAEMDLRRIATIIDSAHDAVFSCDLIGVISSWNVAAERLFKLPKVQALGSSAWRLIPEHRLAETKVIAEEVCQQANSATLETQMLTFTGELVDVAITVSPLPGQDSQTAGFLCVARDITEQKKLAKEFARLDRLYMLGELAAGVTHEVRNPLTTVRGYLQLLRPKEEFAMYRFHFDLMIKEIDRITGLISQHLSLGQYTHSEMQLCTLTGIVESLLPLIEAESLLRGIEVRTTLEDHLPLIWLSDKEIKQLLLNLVQNGMDAMKNGGRELKIMTRSENSTIVLSVEDKGCGIPEHVFENLFTPFQTTKEKGTGLGLVVCRNIARRHNAELKVRTDSSGTCFEVVFPKISGKNTLV